MSSASSSAQSDGPTLCDGIMSTQRVSIQGTAADTLSREADAQTQSTVSTTESMSSSGSLSSSTTVMVSAGTLSRHRQVLPSLLSFGAAADALVAVEAVRTAESRSTAKDHHSTQSIGRMQDTAIAAQATARSSFGECLCLLRDVCASIADPSEQIQEEELSVCRKSLCDQLQLLVEDSNRGRSQKLMFVAEHFIV